MSHQEVSSLLKDTGRAGQDLTLVVARAKVKREEHSEDELASDTDVGCTPLSLSLFMMCYCFCSHLTSMRIMRWNWSNQLDRVWE